MATYWLVSLPLLNDSAEETWRAVVDKCGGATGGREASSGSHRRHHRRSSTLAATTTTGTALADLTKFSLPELRVGTLDALLGLSDDLVRVNAAVEGVTNKLRRQLLELSSSRAEGGGAAGTTLLGGESGASDPQSSSATVDGAPPESYLERFSWDAAKHPPRRPLGETAAAIAETAAKMEGDLKARAGEVAALRSALAAANRKASGSLAVRDLAPLLARAPRGRLVDTENLTTLAVVVPRGAEREWLAAYETLTDFVVPRSGGGPAGPPLAEDGDNVLHTVVLFRRVADAYRAAARARGFQVRDVDMAALAGGAAAAAATAGTNGNGAAAASAAAAAASPSANATASAEALRSELDAKRTALERWSRAAYGEFFLSTFSPSRFLFLDFFLSGPEVARRKKRKKKNSLLPFSSSPLQNFNKKNRRGVLLLDPRLRHPPLRRVGAPLRPPAAPAPAPGPPRAKGRAEAAQGARRDVWQREDVQVLRGGPKRRRRGRRGGRRGRGDVPLRLVHTLARLVIRSSSFVETV